MKRSSEIILGAVIGYYTTIGDHGKKITWAESVLSGIKKINMKAPELAQLEGELAKLSVPGLINEFSQAEN